MATISGTFADDTITAFFSSTGGPLATDDADSIAGLVGADLLAGWNGQDTLVGSFNADTLYGEFDDDLLDGGNENDLLQDHLQASFEWVNDNADTLLGGNGDDTLESWLIADRLDGGAGTDLLRASMNDFTGDIVLVLASTGAATVSAGLGLITGIERLDMSGGSGRDLLDATAFALPDTILGGQANDTLRGGGGNDILIGDDGLDSLEGGAGNDELFGGMGSDAMLGGEGADSLSGEEDGDLLLGEAGDDRILGGTGNDTILGGAGADTIVSGGSTFVPEDNRFYGEGGHDRIFYGAGRETVLGGGGDDTIAPQFISQSNSQSNDESFIAGGNGNDSIQTITQDVSTERLSGGAGNDTVRAGGADRLGGGAGDDLLWVEFFGPVGAAWGRRADGGAGFDTGRFQVTAFALDSGVAATLDAAGTLALRNGAGAVVFTFVACEAFDLRGAQFADLLVGGGAGDTLDGGAGADTLAGGAGDDLLIAGEPGQQESLAGGEGGDTLTSLVDFGTLYGGTTLLGEAGQDLILSTIGTELADGGAGNDSLEGSAVLFSGGDGDDRITATRLVLEADGGAGNDTITIATSATTADLADGGSGSDLLVVEAGLFGPVWLFGESDGSGLLRRGFGWFAYVEIEQLRIAGSVEADRMAAGAGADSLGGDEGADTLLGNGGGDSLDGGLGNDTLAGAAGNDTLLGGGGADRLVTGAGLDTLRWLEWKDGGDVVADFNPADDTLEVSAAGFGGGLVAGALPAGRFVANTTGLATAAFGQFIWETDIGRLWWDLNGTAAGGRVAIATFTGLPALTAADILVIA